MTQRVLALARRKGFSIWRELQADGLSAEFLIETGWEMVDRDAPTYTYRATRHGFEFDFIRFEEPTLLRLVRRVRLEPDVDEDASY